MTSPKVPFDQAAWQLFMNEKTVQVRPIGESFFVRHTDLGIFPVPSFIAFAVYLRSPSETYVGKQVRRQVGHFVADPRHMPLLESREDVVLVDRSSRGVF